MPWRMGVLGAVLSGWFASALAAPSQVFDLPDGFAVERAFERTGSYLALTFDERGRALLALEDGGILWADVTGDEPAWGTLTEELIGCQGLCWLDGALYAVGKRAGELGVWRVRLEPDGLVTRSIELVAPIRGGSEHGAHGLVAGPDGRLWLVLGDEARMASPPESEQPLFARGRGQLLPPLPDPLGHGLDSRYPCGHVVQIDRSSGGWTCHSVGYRNPYDLAFVEGELVTFDSDMEWDLGLPWYRPVRFLHAVPGGDYGSRPGSDVRPPWHLDTLPALADVGRGSPTGLAVYDHERYPERYRGALLAGDWSLGRILALRLEPRGATFRGEIETLVQARSGLAVTDLEVGPDGWLYFTSGGRGAVGRLDRLVYRGELPQREPPEDPLESALRQPQPSSAWARAEVLSLRDRAGPRWADGLEQAARNVTRAPRERARALDLLEACEPERAWSLAAALAGDAAVAVRSRAARTLGRAPAQIAAEPLAALLADGDPALVRRACEALARSDLGGDALDAALWSRLGHADRWVRYAARWALVGRGASGIERLEASRRSDPRMRLEIALVLAELGAESADPGFDELLRASLPSALGEPELALDLLRTLARRVEADPSRAAGFRLLGEQLCGELPNRAPELLRAMAHLAARCAPEAALPALLDALDREPARAPRLDLAYALSAIEPGWTPERARRFFGFLDEAEAWEGGASYGGYLQALRARVEERLTSQQRLALARSGMLGAPTLAHFMRNRPPEEVEPLVAPLYAAWTSPEAHAPPELEAARIRVVRTLAGARSPSLATFLRRLCNEPGPLADEALAALAGIGEPRDWPLFVAGLASPRPLVQEACAGALCAIERAPDVAAPFRAALAAARRLGPERGPLLLRLVEHWAGRDQPAPADGGWSAELLRWERWGAERFPGFAEPDDDALRPAWSFDRTLAFLERSAARPGSRARGARVFEKAACGSCHALEGIQAAPSGGWGPDLTGAASRFDRRALLEAIVFPSRAIAEEYRTTVVETHSEERLEGRLVLQDEGSIELLLADGSRERIALAEVAETRPSRTSMMPEGLLAALTLEELKDLLACLEPGNAAADEGADWIPLFEGDQRSAWDGDPALWRLQRDVLVGSASALEENSYLLSRASWADFEIELDVRLDGGTGNSGLQYRSRPAPSGPDPIGYQADVGELWWGSLFATDGRGILARAADEAWRSAVEPAAWNHYVVTVIGERHRLEINGIATAEAKDGAHRAGSIGFQLHAGTGMTVRFANVRLRPIGRR